MSAHVVKLFGCVLPMLGGCAIGQIGAVIHPTVTGSLSVLRADGTSTQWTPDHCTSGDVSYFLGMDFSAADSRRLRAIREPTGETVVLWTTAELTATLHGGDCTELAMNIQPTGWRVNEVREVAGSVVVHCRLAGGDSLDGTLSVDHCH
jgi:hypothetical protein